LINDTELTKQCEIQGASVPTRFTDHGPVCYTEVDPQCTRLYTNVPNKLSPDGFLLSPLKGEKPQVLPHFQLRHPMLAPPNDVQTKFNMGAQLQTLPYQKISKPLLA